LGSIFLVATLFLSNPVSSLGVNIPAPQVGTSGINITNGTMNHNELYNLPWSVAGHTIDTNVNFNGKNISGVINAIFGGLTLDGDLLLGSGTPVTPHNIRYLNNIYDAEDRLVFETNDRSITDEHGVKTFNVNDVNDRGYYINFENEEAVMPATNFLSWIRLWGSEIENVSVISDTAQIQSVDINNRTLIDENRISIMSWKNGDSIFYKNISMENKSINKVSRINGEGTKLYISDGTMSIDSSLTTGEFDLGGYTMKNLNALIPKEPYLTIIGTYENAVYQTYLYELHFTDSASFDRVMYHTGNSFYFPEAQNIQFPNSSGTSPYLIYLDSDYPSYKTPFFSPGVQNGANLGDPYYT
jgi:hypothetical protein